MNTEHHDGENEKVVSIEPVVLTNVKIRTVVKTVKDVRLIPTDVEVPNYIKKDFIEPVLVPTEYPIPVPKEEFYNVQVPVPKEIPYDLPVVSMDKVNEIASEAVAILGEARVALDKIRNYKIIEEERPTIKYIKNEVLCDIPVVAMDKVNQMATVVAGTLNLAKDMLGEVSAMIGAFRAATAEVDDAVKEVKAKLAEVKDYEIVKVPYEVSVPNYIKEDIRITGKVVSVGQAGG